MNTVVTPLTGTWTDLSAIWAAVAPPAVDGEVITVQASDQGAPHAIEVIQSAAAPAVGDKGHLVAGCDTLALTVAAGRKHYGRSYYGTGGARAVATGEGIAGERGGSSGGGGGLNPGQVTAIVQSLKRIVTVTGATSAGVEDPAGGRGFESMSSTFLVYVSVPAAYPRVNVQLPVGQQLRLVADSVDGDITTDFARVGATRVWRSTVDYDGAGRIWLVQTQN